MQLPLGVRVGEAGRGLPDDPHRLGGGQRDENLLERPPLQERHDQEEATVRQGLEPFGGEDVRVPQPQGVRLTAGAHPPAGDLQRDRAPLTPVLRPVDRARAPFPQLFDDEVVEELHDSTIEPPAAAGRAGAQGEEALKTVPACG